MGIIIILLAIIGTAIIIQGKNAWVCKDGTWTRVGSPQTSEPKQPCPGAHSAISSPTIPPDSTVAGFYTEQMKIQNAAGEAPVKTNTYLSSTYKKPDLCSDEQLKSFKIGKAVSTQPKANVAVELHFETKSTNAQVELIGEGTRWKISKIACK